MYGYIKRKVIWMKNNSTAIDLSRYIAAISLRKNFKSSNNSCSITLFDNNLVYQNGKFVPKENDIFIVYAKLVTNANDRNFTEADALWTGKFVDHSRNDTPDASSVTLTITDFGYDIFNRFWGKSYLNANKKTNEVLIDVIKNMVESQEGLGTYKLDFTNVASKRNDNSDFPVAAYTNINKPVHEWVNELSSTTWTNSESENNLGTSVINQPMIFDIRGVSVYWFEQPTVLSLTVNKSLWINSISQSTSNEATTNYLILECGEDLDGEPIFTYIVDETSESTTIKEGYQYQIKIGGKNNTYDNAYHALRLQYVGDNSGFKEAVIRLAQSFAQTWFKLSGKGKEIIALQLPRVPIELGYAIKIDLPKYDKKTYRVIDIAHDISKEWTMSLQLEEIIE